MGRKTEEECCDSRQGQEVSLSLRPSRPSLGPTNLPIHWELRRLSSGWTGLRLGVTITPYHHLLQDLSMTRNIPPRPHPNGVHKNNFAFTFTSLLSILFAITEICKLWLLYSKVWRIQVLQVSLLNLRNTHEIKFQIPVLGVFASVV
jgi:hypothetical protein